VEEEKEKKDREDKKTSGKKIIKKKKEKPACWAISSGERGSSRIMSAILSFTAANKA
jgi:hypothetical protein